MVTLDLNINDKQKKIQVKDDVLFNAIIVEHPELVKKLIKSVKFSYRVSDAFFCIVNKYIDFDENGLSLYPGLIVRTGLDDFAILYLRDTTLDEDYMVHLVKEFIYDVGDHNAYIVNLYKFAIDRKTFLNMIKHI